MTQNEFNAMLQTAVAQGLPGGYVQSRWAWEDIEGMLTPRSTNLTLASGFETYITPNCYIKGRDGVVHVTLSCKPSGSDTAKNGVAIARLPEGHKPKQKTFFLAFDPYYLKQQIIVVLSDGRISIEDIGSDTWGRVMCELSFNT